MIEGPHTTAGVAAQDAAGHAHSPRLGLAQVRYLVSSTTRSRTVLT